MLQPVKGNEFEKDHVGLNIHTPIYKQHKRNVCLFYDTTSWYFKSKYQQLENITVFVFLQ